MNTLPFVSIIMAIRNEANFIARSLGAVLAQDYPRDRMEIIVADGMSDDGTREIISKFRTRNPEFDIRLLDNPGRIASTGLNMAIGEARGEIIVRVDGHAIIEPDYVRNCVDVLERTGADNVGGPMRAIGEGYLPEAIALATSTPFGIGNSTFHYSDREQIVDTVYLGAFRREKLLEVGLFNEVFKRHQDYELNHRIRKSGGSIYLSPEIRSHYFVRSNFNKLWKQYFHYGFWKGRLLRCDPMSLKGRHAVPPMFLYALILSLILTLALPHWGWLLKSFITGYLAFLLIGTLSAGKLGHPKHAPILPAIFACLHISWGLGVWLGLLSPKLSLSCGIKQKSQTEFVLIKGKGQPQENRSSP